MKTTISRLSIIAGASLFLSGCLLITPYSDQVLSSRTADFPFQAWSSDPGATLKVDCMPTNRYGPEASSHGDWTPVTTVSSSNDASSDLFGRNQYSASKSMSLPRSCWYWNRYNRWYYTSVRVSQDDYGNEDNFEYFTLDREGINCVASSVSTSGNFLQWSNDRCQQRYPGSERSVRWIVMRTQL